MRRYDEEDCRWWWGGGGPEILESMATVCSGAERRSLGGLAPVTPETNSHETPEIASNCQEKIEQIAKELELKKDRLG